MFQGVCVRSIDCWSCVSRIKILHCFYRYRTRKRDANKPWRIEKNKWREEKSRDSTVDSELVMTAERLSDQSMAENNKCTY